MASDASASFFISGSDMPTTTGGSNCPILIIINVEARRTNVSTLASSPPSTRAFNLGPRPRMSDPVFRGEGGGREEGRAPCKLRKYGFGILTRTRNALLMHRCRRCCPLIDEPKSLVSDSAIPPPPQPLGNFVVPRETNSFNANENEPPFSVSHTHIYTHTHTQHAADFTVSDFTGYYRQMRLGFAR